MTKLTYEERKELPQGEFVFPKTRRYPIEDAAHARDALARSSGSRNTQRSLRRSSGSIRRSMWRNEKWTSAGRTLWLVSKVISMAPQLG